MTLLQYSCSHLRFILDERDKWIRRCNRERWTTDEKLNDMKERCPNVYAVYQSDRESCGTTQCKDDFVAPGGDAADDA